MKQSGSKTQRIAKNYRHVNQCFAEYDESFDDVYCDGDVKIDHIPDVAECRHMRKQFAADGYWPNVFHVNDHGNIDLLAIGHNGAKIVKSWV